MCLSQKVPKVEPPPPPTAPAAIPQLKNDSVEPSLNAIGDPTTSRRRKGLSSLRLDLDTNKTSGLQL